MFVLVADRVWCVAQELLLEKGLLGVYGKNTKATAGMPSPILDHALWV